MNYEASPIAITLFFSFVGVTLGLSFWLGRKAKSSAGYFAAHGQIPWFVNGVAFAGDYLSAASFLGICGMIAFHGYDGFLYSIGFLAGWIVALFVIAEPMKRLGKFTFADALDAKFLARGENTRLIKIAAGLSTLAVSIFYLIPQMVGAGSLVTPLLGLPHWAGVVIVGITVILIVTTAGMVSTTWVQFLKGSLLVIFSGILTLMILARGFTVSPQPAVDAEGKPVYGTVVALPDGKTETGPVGPIEYFDIFGRSEIAVPKAGKGDIAVNAVSGAKLLTPGQHPKFAGIRSGKLLDKVNFLSLMLALFCGTASLPHILIRYYTVKDAAAARKSTIVGIATIGFFYVLTLYMGLGAMTSGALDPTDTNMSAPLLARSFGEWIFAAISAIAFTTVLGTVSGLILASAGAVAHDLARHGLGIEMNDEAQVRLAKIASVIVGVVAIVLGIAFQDFNVGYLVGWAFSVAASANLPSLVMLLFWEKTTRQGVVASIIVGMTTSLGWILVSADTVEKVFGWSPEDALTPFTQPGLVTIPLAFAVLIAVSLMTQPKQTDEVAVP